MRSWLIITLPFLLPSAWADAGQPATGTEVHLVRSVTGDWTVMYKLPVETERLGFARNPPVSRADRWTATNGEFEIIRLDDEDIVRRKDGQAFDRVEIALTPVYMHLGADYAPFSSFSDGDMLIYSGRYFACPDSCENVDPTWQFSLTDERGGNILAGGKRFKGRARWTDSADGTMVYLGDRVPDETSRAWVIIDEAFPPQVVAMLNANLPRMVQYFSEKFSVLPSKPVFFASYDQHHPSASGSQGGTLPNQIFMHFFGASLEKRLNDPGFDHWFSWFFAHEAAHLHLTDARDAESWIHEGAADAFAAIVIRGWSDRAREYVSARQSRAREACQQGLQNKSLESAADQGDFPLYYTCGLILHLALDDAMRRDHPQADGLFTLWTAYETEVASGSQANGETFRRVVADLLGAETAQWLEAFTTTPMPEFPD